MEFLQVWGILTMTRLMISAYSFVLVISSASSFSDDYHIKLEIPKLEIKPIEIKTPGLDIDRDALKRAVGKTASEAVDKNRSVEEKLNYFQREAESMMVRLEPYNLLVDQARSFQIKMQTTQFSTDLGVMVKSWLQDNNLEGLGEQLAKFERATNMHRESLYRMKSDIPSPNCHNGKLWQQRLDDFDKLSRTIISLRKLENMVQELAYALRSKDIV